jgi:diguanylate cyclase (GGDEF)-like protein/PAS domain S-box-containing protein
LRKMDEMFEKSHLQSVINRFETLLSLESNTLDLTMERSIEQILLYLNDFTFIKHALDNSVIVATTDTFGKILFVNDKFCEISKYSQEEVIGKDHRIVNSGYHDKAFFKQMWTQINSGDIWEGEIRNMAKDGSIYWVKTTIVPLKDDKDKPIMFMAIRTDITAGKLAQEKLVHALQNDFRLVVNSINTLIFKVTKNHENKFKFILSEGKLANRLGLEMEKTNNKSPMEVFPDELAKMMETKYMQAFNGHDVTYQYSFQGKQLLTNLSPIYLDGEVTEIIGCINDITELHQTQEKVGQMAFHDNLTNLPNRRKFNEDIVAYMNAAKQQGERIAVYLLDLDRIKQTNDTFGHTVGDSLLKEVSSRLKIAVGSNGQVYRFAGDEFLIVIPNSKHQESITLVAQQLLSLFEDVFVLANKLEIYSSASIGFSIYPNHGEDFDTLIKNADIAMYQSKANNGNTFAIYDENMNLYYEEALLIEHHLRKAIDFDELELHFQPKLNLATRKITGVEALLRWNSPILGSIPPSKFIPIAEDTGLIIKIDEWVLEKACRQNKEWNSFNLSTPLKIAVNISPHHFRRPNFENVIKRVLIKTGLDPHLLEIEITEHSVIDNKEECISCLNKLNDMGVSIAIDDFGIGYSSLSYLRKLPIHSLKIDRSFIQEVAENSEDIAIVKAIIILAHELNLKVVAEGIETKEGLDVLEEIGCDEIQGYFISRPLPASSVEEFIKKANN